MLPDEEGEVVVSALETFLSSLTTIATTIWDVIGDVCETIMSEPLLALGIAFFVIGGAVGIVGRLLKRN